MGLGCWEGGLGGGLVCGRDMNMDRHKGVGLTFLCHRTWAPFVAIAQLGERQADDLKVLCSILGLRTADG